MQDRLLTEVERQQKYLDRLGPEFTFPLFNPRNAMESQRRNGYRNTAAAAREIVDNAIEAGATRIDVVFERGGSNKAFARAETVTAIAFIDNGSGMLSQMARCALCLGGGTHFDEPTFIGKFGFGLPNSSINQTRRVEVYTKTKEHPQLFMTYLDVNEIEQDGRHTIPEAAEARLPRFVQRHLEREGMDFEHGTVVVWVEPDRLTYRSGATLKEHLVDDFGVVYRYLLNTFELKVDGVEVQKVDPLFLDPEARLYLKEEEGGAILRYDRTIPVKYFRDPRLGTAHLEKVAPDENVEADPTIIAVGAIQVRISRFPIGFAEYAKKVVTDAHKRLEIKKSRPGMSFVRADREIETVVAFPKSQRDRSSGLGEWPMFQAYVYHLGMEIRFQPQLDDAFGITHDKQSVRPMEDFWRLLAKEEIDRIVREEYRWQPKERVRLKNEADSLQAEKSAEATPAEKAAATADMVQGAGAKVPETLKPMQKRKFDAAAAREAGVTGRTVAEVKDALEKEAKFRPYMIDFTDDPSGPFYVPEWAGAGQVVVKINRRHPFFETLYGPVLLMSQSARIKYGIDVLLLTLAKAELTVENDITRQWYAEQRETMWSPFLRNSLKVLAQSLHEEEVEVPLEIGEVSA